MIMATVGAKCVIVVERYIPSTEKFSSPPIPWKTPLFRPLVSGIFHSVRNSLGGVEPHFSSTYVSDPATHVTLHAASLRGSLGDPELSSGSKFLECSSYEPKAGVLCILEPAPERANGDIGWGLPAISAVEERYVESDSICQQYLGNFECLTEPSWDATTQSRIVGAATLTGSCVSTLKGSNQQGKA